MFVSGAELKRRVRELMVYQTGRELRERNKKMREMAWASWKDRGSSTTTLAKLVDVWNQD